MITCPYPARRWKPPKAKSISSIKHRRLSRLQTLITRFRDRSPLRPVRPSRRTTASGQIVLLPIQLLFSATMPFLEPHCALQDEMGVPNRSPRRINRNLKHATRVRPMGTMMDATFSWGSHWRKRGNTGKCSTHKDSKSEDY